MAKYRVLKDFKGSQHGYDCQEFKKGQEVDLSDSLAATALLDGDVTPVVTDVVAEVDISDSLAAAPEEQVTEEKAEDGAPENKAVESAPENKASKKTGRKAAV